MIPTNHHTEHRSDILFSVPEKRHSRIYEKCARYYDAFKTRVRFLGWEVHVELLEIIAGASLWILSEDMVDLYVTGSHNPLYDALFLVHPNGMPPSLFWGSSTGALAVLHTTGVLADRVCFRSHLMAFAAILLLGITVSMWGSAAYALAWKFVGLFTFAAAWSHVRLRKQCHQSRKAAVKADTNRYDATGQTR